MEISHLSTSNHFDSNALVVTFDLGLSLRLGDSSGKICFQELDISTVGASCVGIFSNVSDRVKVFRKILLLYFASEARSVS
jgi:hypothetical protein